MAAPASASTLGAWLEGLPYLATALAVAALLAIGVAAFPRQRAGALRAAWLSLPGGLWALVLVPAYWTPRLLVRVGRVGLEDFVWAFSTGGLAWLAATVPAGPTLARPVDPRGALRRFAAVLAIGHLAFLPPWLAGVPVMTASTLGMAAVAVVLLARHPRLWRLAIRGGIGFGIVNALVMKANLLMHPDYYGQMAVGALSGVEAWRIPIEELPWAVAAGAGWPLIACHVFGCASGASADAPPAESRPRSPRSRCAGGA